jgi:hypothetical protein
VPQQGYPPQGYAAQPQPEVGYAAQGPATSFATEAAPRRRGVNPTPIVLGILLVGIILAAGWAVTNALQPFGGGTASETVASSPTADATGTPTDAGTEPAAQPTTEVRPVIAGAAQIGPAANCQGEQPEAAPLAVDGDPTTFWFTCTYRAPDFGGLREGVGIAVTLREPAPVSKITLLTNSTGGNVQIRKTTVDKPTEGPVLAEGPIAPSTELTFAQPEVGDSFVIWVTQLPQSDGRNRLELIEVTLQ